MWHKAAQRLLLLDLGAMCLFYALGLATERDALFVATTVLWGVGVIMSVATIRHGPLPKAVCAVLLCLGAMGVVSYIRFDRHNSKSANELQQEQQRWLAEHRADGNG